MGYTHNQCYICHEPDDKPGKSICSRPHGRLALLESDMGNVAPDFEAFIKNGQDAQKAIDVTIQFEDRMKKKEEAESKQEEIDAEKKRQDYLTRTGRTEMKP